MAVDTTCQIRIDLWEELKKKEIDAMLSEGMRDIARGRTVSREEMDAYIRERFWYGKD